MSIAKPQNLSLIDTLSAGYRALHRRLWVVCIPAGLSTYLWLGAPVGLGALAGELQPLVDAAGELIGGEEAGSQALQGLLERDVRVALAWLNYIPVLAPEAARSPALGLGGPLQLLAAVVIINALALLASSLFLTILGDAVRGELLAPLALLRRAGQVAAHIGLSLLALVGVVLVLALPFLAISAIVIAALPGAAMLVLLLWYIVLFWAYVYTGFAPEAILISRAGPLRAIYNSVHMVRRELGATLGLLLLSFVIVSGLGIIWQRLAVSPGGLVLAILGSAYVGSGLSAARLEFYRAVAAKG
ncbi:MAG: hypothetical protein OHK0015_48990 [Chloroflexi bacterium OHK40]